MDQSILGKTPRSNPAVYIGAFDDIRELFAQSDAAKQRGLNASAFSFNSAQGQCERCRGAGFEKIEMQFLSDVFIRCPDCNGRRYRSHILEVEFRGNESFRQSGRKQSNIDPASGRSPTCSTRRWMKRSSSWPHFVSRAGTAGGREPEAAAGSGSRLPAARPAHQHVVRR